MGEKLFSPTIQYPHRLAVPYNRDTVAIILVKNSATPVCGWLPVMDVHLDEDTISAIHAECELSLAGYVVSDGSNLVMPTTAHIFSGTVKI